MTRLIRWIRSWTRFDWAWLGFIGLGLSIEWAALRDAKSGGTFSDAWYWLTSADKPARGRWRLIRIVALALTAWTVAHLWKKGFV